MTAFIITENHYRNRGSWWVKYILDSENIEKAKEITRKELGVYFEDDFRPYGSDYFEIEEIDISKMFQISESE